MRIEIMRWVDRYIGSPIVAGLSLFKTQGDNSFPHSIDTIIVSKYFGLGSILMATPLLRLLRSEYPQAHIAMVTFKKNEGLLCMFDFVDEAIWLDGHNLASFLKSSLGAILTLRRLKADVFFDLEFFSRYSAMISFLSGAEVCAGFSTPKNPRNRILTHPLEVNYPEHTTKTFLSQAIAIGLANLDQNDAAKDGIFNIHKYIPKEGFVRVNAVLHSRRITGFVVFNATGGEAIGKEREWPGENWASLARLIGQELGIHVIFTGEKSRAPELDNIVRSCDNPKIHNLGGLTTLYEFIALIALARAVVTIDSAALHIAQSVGTPCVSLHGPELPIVNTYPGNKNRALHKGWDGTTCPCFNFYENKETKCFYENRCMKAIQVQEVYDALNEVLSISESPDDSSPGEIFDNLEIISGSSSFDKN